MRYSDRQWLVLRSMTHAYLIGNPPAYPDVPADKRLAYELLVRGIHRFLERTLSDTSRSATPRTAGDVERSDAVKDLVSVQAQSPVPDDAELERLIMVDRAADKVSEIVRTARRTDSTFSLANC